MACSVPKEVGGYVLAGGKSLRMGRDKALLELAGKPLVRHAVKKLRRVCMDVRILSGNPELAEFAPIVADLHPGCGPLGGLEAALMHSTFDWSLFLPVDMPFLPTAFLSQWVRRTMTEEKRGARLAMFTVDGVPQPTLAMVHRDVAPFVASAVERGEFKLYPVLERAARELAAKQGGVLGRTFRNLPWNDESTFQATPNLYGPRQEGWMATTEAQQSAKHLWFANLNTPEEFAEAERHVDALDT
ncbi:molybdenum cofactor guanylyltransferase [Tunturiibacter empetritectus]|uniref:Probable molybdenum cofactor guanylyltransferase n=1 Tax=Tunturiibacter lichenicola TaxID=2051959 RepID=A0A852VBU4_9BACT|nr:molybdenum cofactor guanylyltransferase [Edaphobacter lichenicola]NYF89160.1 molybdopterin-guanine dinucleotide biosynthesis protein A [Edaphobacter lichenicola]